MLNRNSGVELRTESVIKRIFCLLAFCCLGGAFSMGGAGCLGGGSTMCLKVSDTRGVAIVGS